MERQVSSHRSSTSSNPSGERREGFRILLIEDDTDHRFLERKALQKLGMGTEVVTVRTAIEGLAALHDRAFDLVVADYRMPEMDGVTFLRTLKERRITVPVVIVTGLGNERVAVEALKQGAHDYIIKEPGYLDLLPSVAERAIEAARTQQQLEEARQRLAESEERYRQLVHGVDAIVWEADPRTRRFTFVNQRAEAILGYPVDQWLNEPDFWNRVIHPAEREQWTHGPIPTSLCSSATTEKQDCEFEFRARAADGRTVWLRNIVRVVCQNGTATSLRGLMVDITEQKLMEEELQRQKKYWESLTQYSPLAIVILDMDHRVISCNPAFERLFHYHESEIKGKNLDDLVTDEETVAEARAWTEAVLAGGTIRQVARRRRKDGTLLDVEVFGVPVVVEGEQIGVLALYHDITDRRRAEEELWQRHQELSTLYAIAMAMNRDPSIDSILHNTLSEVMSVLKVPFGCIYIKHDDQFLLRSHRGFPAEVARQIRPFRLSDRPWLADVHLVNGSSGEVHQGLDDWEKALGIRTRLSVPLRTKNDFIGIIQLAAQEIDRFTTAAISLTSGVANQLAIGLENARLYEQIKASEAKYRSIFENVVVGLYQTSPDGKVLTANPALVRMLGYDSLEELLAVDVPHDLYVDPADREKNLEILHRTGRLDGVELHLRRKDGQEIIVLEHARAIRDANGRILYYEGTLMDITEKKALEQRLLQAQKMESIGTLAGGIAHDFNNLLQGILGYVSLALQNADQQSELHHYLQTIFHSAKRAADLTNQMLTFSRRREPRFEPTDVNQLVEESLRMLRRLIPTTIDIRTRLEKELWTVEADATQLQQVLVNLCVNARDAMPRGGILTLETENRVISPQEAEHRMEAQAGRYIVLTVSDNGVGMTPEIRERIFEPFFTTKGVGEGTGLGLSVVYGIVRSHKGWINVYSEPGQGSVFRIYLPAAERAVAPPPSAPPSVARGKEGILVVDDEPIVLDLACHILEHYGYHTLKARDGEEAINIYRQRAKEIDLVLLDLTMPKLSGLECAKRLRALNPSVRLVLSSGYSAQAEQMPNEGIHAFVPKPYSPEQLACVVREVLDRSDDA